MSKGILTALSIFYLIPIFIYGQQTSEPHKDRRGLSFRTITDTTIIYNDREFVHQESLDEVESVVKKILKDMEDKRLKERNKPLSRKISAGAEYYMRIHSSNSKAKRQEISYNENRN